MKSGLATRVGTLMLATTFLVVATPGVERVQVEPEETTELLTNPGMGWQTFGRFADEDRNLEGLPSASAYFRFYWREIEPQQDQSDSARFDELLAHAARVHQKLAFRIMCTGSGEYIDVPQWLKDQGCEGVDFEYEGRKHWVPDFKDNRFQRAHSRLIRELGRRYDGNPNLDLVDLGSVGLWGEWHMSGTSQSDTGQPVPLPPLEVRQAIIDVWCESFPKTSKVILIGSDEGMAQAFARHYGWRADCLGDMGGFSKTWNHMQNFYLQQLTNTGATDAWKHAPVAFETCWDMRKWKQAGWDIRYIFDYALNCHASYVNNKSAPLPEGSRPEVERLLRKLGYRLVIRSVEHAGAARTGNNLAVSIRWENIGVAPPYRDYKVAFRVTPQNAAQIKPIICVTDDSIQGWLPGGHRTESSLKLPPSLTRGSCELAVGLVGPDDSKPAVRLAIKGCDSDGWYPLSHFELVE